MYFQFLLQTQSKMIGLLQAGIYSTKSLENHRMVNIQLINALSDNYIACIINAAQKKCAIVDPGEADPVFNFLNENHLSLSGILITHHHWDHINGIEKLLHKFDVPVYGPAKEPVAGMIHLLNDGAVINLEKLGITLKVMHVPGHTLGHIAYFNDDFVFTGDTLFMAGCGKIFEGTVDQMYNSLMRLVSLNEKTLVYCGHEYTTSNLKFALKVEPENLDIQQRIDQVTTLRQKNLPSVPAPLSLEKLTNPFLRCAIQSVKKAAENYAGKALNTPQEILGILRAWKNTQ